MQTFFFDVSINGNLTMDEGGTSLKSIAAARREAVHCMTELINRESCESQKIEISVSDQLHDPLFVSNLTVSSRVA